MDFSDSLTLMKSHDCMRYTAVVIGLNIASYQWLKNDVLLWI